MDNDHDHFNREYTKHLECNLDVLQGLIKEAISKENSCLMCMERNPKECHRKIVAERIRELSGLRVRHLCDLAENLSIRHNL